MINIQSSQQTTKADISLHDNIAYGPVQSMPRDIDRVYDGIDNI